MQRTSARQMLNILTSVQTEAVQHRCLGVFNDIEIAVVAVTGHHIAILAVPLGMLHANILGGNHLAVEHHIFGTILLVEFLDDAEHFLYILGIARVVAYLDAQELGSLDQTVDADGEVLTADIDISGIKEG